MEANPAEKGQKQERSLYFLVKKSLVIFKKVSSLWLLLTRHCRRASLGNRSLFSLSSRLGSKSKIKVATWSVFGKGFLPGLQMAVLTQQGEPVLESKPSAVSFCKSAHYTYRAVPILTASTQQNQLPKAQLKRYHIQG